MSDDLNWNEAIERVNRLLKQSQELARECPSAFMGFYDRGLQILRARYERGERGKELYNAMMEYAE